MLRIAPLAIVLTSTVMAQNPNWFGRPEISPRIRARAAYDEARQRVVAFGGIIDHRDTNETIEWNGHEWIVRSPAHAPSARDNHAVAYDAARQCTVLFGGYGASDDTWTWDGNDWTAHTPAQTPPGRIGHALAFDPIRERIVLFGGFNGIVLDDTWEWDGVNWTQASPTVRPQPRTGHFMAWDPVSQQIVSCGGSSLQGRLTDTWGFDGTTWTRLATAGPTVVNGMATDPIRQRVVVRDERGAWEWDGATWTLVTTAHTTFARSNLSLAFDGRNGAILLGFGSIGSQNQSDTWLYDGVDWTRVDARGQPSFTLAATDTTRGRVVMRSLGGPHPTWEWDGVRWNAIDSVNTPPGGPPDHSMAFDSIRQRTVLFGGAEWVPGGIAYNNVHWEWDGTNWTKLPSTGPIPSPRTGTSLAFDATRNRLLLFGGSNGTTLFNDTWEWDGANWQLLSPATRPSPRSLALLAHDPLRGVVVMWSEQSRDTWEWNGVDWIAMSPSRAPPTSSRASMVFDPTRGRVIVVATNVTAQVWEWDGVNWIRSADIPNGGVRNQAAAWDPVLNRLLVIDDANRTWMFGTGSAAAVQEFGAGCVGSEGTPRLCAVGLPYLGRSTFALELGSSRRNAPAALMIGPLAASVPIGPCTLLVGAGSAHVPLQIGRYGLAELGLPIPVSAPLLGLAMSCQGIVLDPAGALGLFAASGGVRFTVGL